MLFTVMLVMCERQRLCTFAPNISHDLSCFAVYDSSTFHAVIG